MRQVAKNIIIKSLERMREQGQISIDEWPNFSVDLSKNPEHGDFAVNVAMMLAKPLRRKPRDIAEDIVAAIDDSQGFLSDVHIAGPGFINLRMSPELWQQVIDKVEKLGRAYGHAKQNSKGHVNIEFISANPTGPLHVGHGRGAVVGDALARLLAAAGFQVTREYYVNDHGNQVDILARSIHLRYQELFGRAIDFPKDAYPADYVRDIAKKMRDEHGDQFLDADESKWLGLFRERGMEINLLGIKQVLKSLDISIDEWSAESDLHASGAVRAVVNDLAAQDLIYKAAQSEAEVDKVRRQSSKAAQHSTAQHGGTFARLSKFGDSDDRILLRSDGSPVYLTADLAYHRDKLKRGYDLCIDVMGADHFSHTKTLKAGTLALGEESERLEFVLTQIVRLMRDGQELRISKRAGNIELLSDLTKTVGTDATRFFFLLRAPNAQFDFDLDVAASKSIENPVYYVQYGHARICAIFRRAEAEQHRYKGFDAETMQALTLPEELALLRKIASFAEIIQAAAKRREPHQIVYYITELIKEFHSYYTRYRNSERVVSDDKIKTQARLGLLNALRQTIRNGLDLLGVSAPEQMQSLQREDDQDAAQNVTDDKMEEP